MRYDPPGEYAELLRRLASRDAKKVVEPEAERGAGAESLVTEEVRKMIGAPGESFTCPEPVDRSTVRRFTDATFETKPIYCDLDHAKKSRYGELCVPPAYVLRPPFGFWDRGMSGEAAVPHVEIHGVRRGVNGGNEAEWFRPVKLGDTVTQRAYIKDIVQRTGRAGPLVLIIAETVFTNQRREIVARSQQTTIRMP